MSCLNFKYCLNFISATMLSQYFHCFQVFSSLRVIILEITWILLNVFLLCLHLFDLFIKTLILTVLACIIMKVVCYLLCIYFDYT